ncbi:MAG: hypothetical protein FD123_2957 [Bacteroidetes bacterium]|nr:MAG: hypothetical protein FD123_2957 [Bacteroidota bacterium]
MKKAIAIFFCLQILTGNTFAMEVAKLPFLVQHYLEHEQNDHPGIGFGTFLLEHYVDDDHADEEQGHCDEKLPFKHCHDCCAHQSSVAIFTLPDSVIQIKSALSAAIPQFSFYQSFTSSYHNGIWQPPKIG